MQKSNWKLLRIKPNDWKFNIQSQFVMIRFISCIKLCLIKVCTPILLIAKLQLFVILLFFKAKMHIQRPREVRFRHAAKYIVDYMLSLNWRWYGLNLCSISTSVMPEPLLFCATKFSSTMDGVQPLLRNWWLFSILHGIVFFDHKTMLIIPHKLWNS